MREAHTERLIERGLLFDYYGGLLNEKNKRIYEAAAVEDMSLSEISEEMGISRQAVSETLRRIDIRLQGYDKELGLISKGGRIGGYLGELRDLLAGAGYVSVKAADKKGIEKILKKIEEEL
ncbi:MAG: DNA-binding protein [Lachnospiraceae bacterium]|nr:DNA-binding protein [Lachnospiraceae bacterium]